MTASLHPLPPLVARLSLVISIAGCAEFPMFGDTHTSLDVAIDAQLEQACPIQRPGLTEKRIQELRIMRAQIILAAIAGYADTSIANYSSALEVRTDSLLVLDKLKDAELKLAKLKTAVDAGSNMFDLYRADLVIAAGGAADAALRPTMRAVKATLLSPSVSPDMVKRSKQFLLNILKDQLYLKAINTACERLDPSRLDKQWAFATGRYVEQCEPLAKAAGVKRKDYCTELPWQLPATATAPPGPVAAAGNVRNDNAEEGP